MASAWLDPSGISAGVGILGGLFGGEKTPQRPKSEAIPANYAAQNTINMNPVTMAANFRLAERAGFSPQLMQSYANTLPTQGLPGERSRVLGYNFLGPTQPTAGTGPATTPTAQPLPATSQPSIYGGGVYSTAEEQAIINRGFSQQANAIDQAAHQKYSQFLAQGMRPEEAQQRVLEWSQNQKMNYLLSGTAQLQQMSVGESQRRLENLANQGKFYQPQPQVFPDNQLARMGYAANQDNDMWAALAGLANVYGQTQVAKQNQTGQQVNPSQLPSNLW